MTLMLEYPLIYQKMCLSKTVGGNAFNSINITFCNVCSNPCSVVVNYTIAVFEQTLDTDDMPQMERIHNIENTILNQTDNLWNELETFNQTELQQIEQGLP
ncbi:MAG: hypothetical protein WC325_07650 [Candidatus Bathyarchaeia archaeon]|jgi:hypothetical protein